MTIFKKSFWLYAGERALKTFIQTLLSAITVTGIAGVLDVSWVPVLSASLLAAVISILTSVVAVLPANPVEPTTSVD